MSKRCRKGLIRKQLTKEGLSVALSLSSFYCTLMNWKVTLPAGKLNALFLSPKLQKWKKSAHSSMWKGEPPLWYSHGSFKSPRQDFMKGVFCVVVQVMSSAALLLDRLTILKAFIQSIAELSLRLFCST